MGSRHARGHPRAQASRRPRGHRLVTDGSIVATGCDDGVCRLWDPQSGDVLRTLDDANAAVRFVRFAADGSTLLVGAYDATMRVYDTSTWTVRSQLRHPIQWERAAVQASDRVIIGSFGANPVVHPIDDDNAPSFTYGINFLAVDDTDVVVGRDDGSVMSVRPASTGAAARRLLARHTSIVNGAAFSPDGRHVASTDYRGVIHISRRDGSATTSFAAPEGGPINSVVWHPGGEMLFTAGYDGVIRRWHIEGHHRGAWPAHHSPIKSLTYSRSCDLLIAGSSDGTLSAWSDGDQAWRADDPTMVLVNSVAADDVGVIVSASRDLQVRRWDAATGALIEALPRVHRKSIKAIATTGGGDRLVSGSYDGTATLWHLHNGRWTWKRLLHHGKPGVPAVGFGNGASLGRVFTAGWDGSLAWWGVDGSLLGFSDLTGEP
ncbi:MAG: WD40 repeat domain-containing protein [Acidimicrobiia bacterium]